MAFDEAKDGGPAFPTHQIVDVYRNEGYVQEVVRLGGMSLRDYFAAHAPAEPQEWFKPAMPAPRPEIEQHFTNADDPFLRLDFVNGVNNELYDGRTSLDLQIAALKQLTQRPWWIKEATAPVSRWLKRRADQTAALEEWQGEYARERILQWPYAWADSQIAERKKR